MEYQIHGRKLIYEGGECGIYKNDTAISQDYATMDERDLVNAINRLPKERAIEAVVQLRELASEQSKMSCTPQNAAFPILRKIPGTTPIDDVRKNIENTVTFTDEILKILRE